MGEIGFDLKMEHLVNTFHAAKDSGARFVAIVIQMEGFQEDEIIVNPSENFESKLAYYQKTYDENLQHKFAPGISITGFTFGENFGSLSRDLFQ